jgi:hypothetical protein
MVSASTCTSRTPIDRCVAPSISRTVAPRSSARSRSMLACRKGVITEPSNSRTRRTRSRSAASGGAGKNDVAYSASAGARTRL